MQQFTAEQLNNCSKEEIISLLLRVQQENALFAEKLAVMQANRFGRKSEKLECDGQETFFLNEMEAESNVETPEPEVEEIAGYKRKRPAGKRAEDLKNFPVRVVNHELSEDELKEIFGSKGWKRLPDQVYRKLEMRPAVYEVLEHHVAVYAGKDDQTIVKAKHPAELLPNSVATPSLVAAVMNAKYTNAMPLYRICQEFERNDVMLSRQTLANWVIRSAERYLSLAYGELKQELLKSHIIQADETPVKVSKDGRAAGSESYMWLYRTGEYSDAPPIVLYEYQKTRSAEHPQRFLKGFSGILVCDGYPAYHKLDAENETIRVANCWAHARRRYANALKVYKGANKQAAKKTLAHKALTMISKIYEEDEKGAKLLPDARKEYRQQKVAPLVEAYFAWVNEHKGDVPPKSETGEGFTYSLNQRKYLEVFLEDGSVPLDNSASERAIRPLAVGRKNWQMIDTIHGANASAMIYSLVETAKANNLKPYEYLKHLLSEIPQHMEDTGTAFLSDLLPWSPQLPQVCKKSNPQ